VGRKLYVGNLPFSATEEDISAKFSACGTVESAKLITDRDTGRSKGFGFVQMGTDEEAQAAIAAMSGQENDGRALTVNEAKPREERSGGGSRGGYGGGNRSGGGGGYGGGASRSGGYGGGNAGNATSGYVERGSTGGRSGGAEDRGNKRY
jgi:RNA recognition motif-containing protein